MTKKKKYRGLAKVEFLAHKPDILDKLAKGYSVRMIYDELAEKGKISVGYPQFCRYVSGAMPRIRPPAQPALKASAVMPREGLPPSPQAALAQETPPSAPVQAAVQTALPPASNAAPRSGPKVLDTTTGAVTPVAEHFASQNFQMKKDREQE